MKSWKHFIFGLSVAAFALFGMGQLEAGSSSASLIAKGGHHGEGHHGGGHHGGHHGHHGHHGGHHGHHHGHHGHNHGWGNEYYWGGAGLGLGGAYYPYYYADPGYYERTPSTYYYQTVPSTQYVVPVTESTVIQQEIPIKLNTEYSQ